MRPKAARILLAALASLALAPLAHAQSWKLAVENQPHVNPGRGYSVQFPPGWKFNCLWFSDETGATRDGPELQAIFVDFRAHKNAFKALKRDASPDMMPQEMAESLVADMAKERGLEKCPDPGQRAGGGVGKARLQPALRVPDAGKPRRGAGSRDH